MSAFSAFFWCSVLRTHLGQNQNCLKIEIFCLSKCPATLHWQESKNCSTHATATTQLNKSHKDIQKRMRVKVKENRGKTWKCFFGILLCRASHPSFRQESWSGAAAWLTTAHVIPGIAHGPKLALQCLTSWELIKKKIKKRSDGQFKKRRGKC